MFCPDFRLLAISLKLIAFFNFNFFKKKFKKSMKKKTSLFHSTVSVTFVQFLEIR